MAKILLVEDDPALSEMVSDWLEAERHTIEAVKSFADAQHRLKMLEYDLVILDWQLPDGVGVDLLRGFRARNGQTPVLMLTGKKLIAEKEEGFEAGADDYLTKPFNIKELVARVKALLRRQAPYQGSVLTAGALTLDTAAHRVTKRGEEIRLLPKEFTLLEFFMRHPDQCFTGEALIQRLWSTDQDVSIDALRQSIKRLREKIDDEGGASCITNLRGVGYKLEMQ